MLEYLVTRVSGHFAVFRVKYLPTQRDTRPISNPRCKVCQQQHSQMAGSSAGLIGGIRGSNWRAGGASIAMGMTRVAGTLHILARALQLLIEIVSLR